ncbi:DUF1385 domain-containing protein [Peribacillus simplex]|uniref:DUF1385 domain-containing protein n=1 Tax=Peribacillus simplex TaxID=1478 RepID=A0AAW7IRE4_9BACI|nr:DUF1385 domain-containing protein [Peribacillus simplex]MDM5293948.1 DUF1385 domain-containing protein [Peribacillus simplex]MDM5452893.1 DUF1385 domain-containing protein [Peribacillus simplex]
MSEVQKPVYGGQAVVEGVMFGGKHHTVTAVRRKDSTIVYYHLPRETKPVVNRLKKVPFLRGLVSLIQSSAIGSKHLNFSTEQYEEEGEKRDEKKKETKESSKLSVWLGVAVIGVLSFLFGKLLFTLIPVFLAELTRPIFSGHMAQVLIESLFKLILLLVYIYLVSMTPLIKRVFQYHGAEHKVINCFESGKELTVANVQASSRLHYRCGSSFILFTVIVGMFVYMLVPIDPLWLRVVDRVLLIPVVLGIAFEVLQLTNKVRDIPILRYLGYPGLWLQLLTTKAPTDDQVEVALASFHELLRMEKKTEKGLESDVIV